MVIAIFVTLLVLCAIFFVLVSYWTAGVIPPGSPVEVSLHVTPDSGGVPLTVTYQSSASRGTLPYSYYVGFGDGNNSTSPNGTHTYSVAGNFTIEVVVTDSANETGVATAQVVVGGGTKPSGLPALGFGVYDPANALWVVDNSGLLQANDTFVIQSHSGNVGELNTDANEIHTVDPGATFVAQTRGPNAGNLLDGTLSPLFSAISLLITPSTVNPPYQSTEIQNLTRFTEELRGTGFESYDYATGKGIHQGWNYTRFGVLVNHQIVETQHSCGGTVSGVACAASFAGQYTNASLSPVDLSLQRSLGPDNLSDCWAMYNATQTDHLGYLFLEFSGPSEASLTMFLRAVGR